MNLPRIALVDAMRGCDYGPGSDEDAATILCVEDIRLESRSIDDGRDPIDGMSDLRSGVWIQQKCYAERACAREHNAPGDEAPTVQDPMTLSENGNVTS